MQACLYGCVVWGAMAVTFDDLPSVVSYCATRGYGSVVVIPEALLVDGSQYKALPIGPLSRACAKRIRDELSELAEQRFQVVTAQAARDAVVDHAFSELHRTTTRRRILEKTEAEAAVFVFTDAVGQSDISVRFEVWPEVAPTTLTMSLCDMAYAGRSFEVRRWNGDQFELVGFKPTANHRMMLGMGREYEEFQAKALRPELAHPLDRADFPVPIQIAVGNEIRQIQAIGKRRYVRLEAGEEFTVKVENKDQQHKLLMGLYVNGSNTYGAEGQPFAARFEHPDHTPSSRHWVLRPDFVGRVEGWSELKGGNPVHEDFVVSPASDEMAHTLGDQHGLITALIYTDGLVGIKDAPPANDLTRRGPSTYIGRGEVEPAAFRFQSGKKGLLLAALTIHHRTGRELRELERSSVHEGN